MPKGLGRCVESLIAKWLEEPSSRPDHDEGQDAKSQAFAICTVAMKRKADLEADDGLVLLRERPAGHGATLVGVALTNRPYIKRVPPVQVITVGDEEKLLVPLLRSGSFRHKRGRLAFGDEVFASMRRNFKDDVVGTRLAVDCRHKPEWGALGWIESVFTGKDAPEAVAAQVRNLQGDLLYVLATPTSKGSDVVKSKAFQYASAEFHPDYLGNELSSAALSSDELEEIDAAGELFRLAEEEARTMTDLNARVAELEKELAEKEASLEEQSRQLAEATKEASGAIIALDDLREGQHGRIVELEYRLHCAEVAALIADVSQRADENGRRHSKVVLDTFTALMLGDPVGDEDTPIELESDEGDAAAVHAYYRSGLQWLLENMPGQVPSGDGVTEGDDTRRLDEDSDEAKAEAGRRAARAMYGLEEEG